MATHTQDDSDTSVLEREEQKERLDEVPLYKLIMLNDDYTPMEFVIFVLQTFLRKSELEAEVITMAIHEQGQGVCGIFPLEIAEYKQAQVETAAREAGHPLACKLEMDSPSPSRGQGMKR